MAEREWFLLEAGERSFAVARELLWGFAEGEALRPLPGGRGWCAGWVPLGGRLVPVVRGGGSGWEGCGDVLAVLHWGEHLVALPCGRADVARDRQGPVPEGAEGPLRAGVLEASGAFVLDVERLYTALGIL